MQLWSATAVPKLGAVSTARKHHTNFVKKDIFLQYSWVFLHTSLTRVIITWTGVDQEFICIFVFELEADESGSVMLFIDH